MITIKFNPLESVIHVYYDGNIVISDILNYHIELRKIVLCECNLRILEHYNNVHFDFKPSDLNIIYENVKKRLEVKKSTKVAFLTEETIITAYALIYINKLGQNDESHKVFSTEKAALEWLKI